MTRWDEGGEPEKKIGGQLKPYRDGAKPIGERRFIEDCDVGDLVTFPLGPPSVVVGGEPRPAPSDSAKVTCSIAGGVFVRFIAPGGEQIPGGPLHVADGTPIRRIGGNR